MYTTREARPVPLVTFKIRQDDSWVNVTSDEIFSGKNIIVFGLPGAYTPTCSSSHLPGYEALYEVFRQHGIDEIYCLAVNDTFVLNAWASDEKIKHVKMLPDGNGEFTEKMGLTFNAQELGFGKRSWRYSMLVRDGIIEKQFIEPVEPGDPFKVSDANTLLTYIAPDAKLPQSVSLFTKPGCPFCAKAKHMLNDRNIPFEEIILGQATTSISLKAVTGQNTTPQAFVDGVYIGDTDQLEEWLSHQEDTMT
ncbi:MAG: glutathione peroxidase [Endozoicomonas sp. (ex Botrylloides leachii)]|nr:glutathione peroxidase [Endozoicomonas sp. (ex Botrylloides leachii)]